MQVIDKTKSETFEPAHFSTLHWYIEL